LTKGYFYGIFELPNLVLHVEKVVTAPVMSKLCKFFGEIRTIGRRYVVHSNEAAIVYCFLENHIEKNFISLYPFLKKRILESAVKKLALGNNLAAPIFIDDQFNPNVLDELYKLRGFTPREKMIVESMFRFVLDYE
jgi:hypothetical protein